MNFSVSDSIGLVGSIILFGALFIAFVVVALLIVRVVRGRDDTPPPSSDRAPDEDDVI